MEQNPWHSTLTSELLENLRTCGLDVPEGLPEELVRRSDESLEPLCDILLGRGFEDLDDEDGDTWASIHALHLLGAIGNSEALPSRPVLSCRDLSVLYASPNASCKDVTACG